MRRNMETTERRDGYPAARVLAGGQLASDRLISARPDYWPEAGTVRLDIINPASGEIKTWAIGRESWAALVAGAAPADAEPDPAARLLAELLADASGDQERYAIEDAAVRAGILLKCAEPDCGRGVGAPGDDCQACGEQFSECAICVPGQCPGPDDCPGNYARQDERP